MEFTIEQARETAALLAVDFETVGFSEADFLAGMNVELEHGTRNPATNVTDDQPLQTGKIALAHLLETPKYYAPGVGLEAWEEKLKAQNKAARLGKQTKTIAFKSDAHGEEGVFSGYGAVFGNLDSGGDIIEKGAFTKTLKDWSRVKVLALHDESNLPIGIPLLLKETEKGLYIKAKISDTAMGRDVKALLKDGVLTELSIGYEPVTYEIDEHGIRHLTEVELWEVSVVTWAMNDEATIREYKKRQSNTTGGRENITGKTRIEVRI
jgi:HK97 family phage prohead protease